MQSNTSKDLKHVILGIFVIQTHRYWIECVEYLLDLEMEEEKVHGLAVLAEDSEYETASPKGSSSDSESPKSEISDLEAHNNLKSWRGFLRKLKKGPAKSLHTFHPSMPSFSRRLPRKKSRNEAQSMPAMPPNLDAELYCFEASWINFSLSDLKHATNNFSKGLYFLLTLLCFTFFQAL